MKRFVCWGGALIYGTALALGTSQPQYEQSLPLEHPAIQYPRSEVLDAVAALGERIASGTLALEVSGRRGVLPSLLRELGINADSQTLVFSKTSFQHPRIGPRNPRAIYFNDEVAVGVVPGTTQIELVATNPRQGAMFYTLEGASLSRPVIRRRDVCLRCHHGVATLGVPGMFVSSVVPTSSGTPEREGGIITDHRTLFPERWGGWYVTGTHGRQAHRGNAVASNPAEPTALDTANASNLTSLASRFNVENHLVPTSDLVALMTFEHQTQMLNYLTRLGWEARILAGARANVATPPINLDARVEEVARYMLFVDEAAIIAPMRGVSTFAKTFAERGPRDRRGRSLRDFDLERRLFRYPLSYLIYSASFDALPDDVRERLLRRLFDILIGKERHFDYARLSPADRTAILTILRETKPNLPEYWRTTRVE